MFKLLRFLSLFTTLIWSVNAFSFSCITAGGANIPIGGGAANVYVNLSPVVLPGQNLVVDLSTQISCRNNSVGGFITDFLSIKEGSAFGGVLSSFSGILTYEGVSYPFPLTTQTHVISFNSETFVPWPTVLYLTPISSAGGVAVTAGSLIAVLNLQQDNDIGSPTSYFIWNIYANNDVVIPTGGCDVSSRDVSVTLPDYPGGNTPVPLTVRCAQSQSLGFYLSGSTVDPTNSIFSNTASASPAQGVGVQLSRNGSILPANNTVALGTVNTSPVSLGLSANYARTGGQVTAGNVHSVIGVTFVYL
ncbi:fimbrial protein [Enterobacter sp. M4-VN]|uniref:fimbrial protein n=1 Tax=Enterobacter sp. M4-VN TaxID=2724127 RepID=UPI001484672A|nr:fimbrial protein [Enterobacter sp. M4-VN]GFM11849.1 protein FimH [Enterobacter sp. M4-VN]